MSARSRSMLTALPLCAALGSPAVAVGPDGGCAHGAPALPPATGDLTLADALERSLRHHPDLVVAECAIAAAEGRVIQAGLRPNPEAGFEVENVAGSGRLRELESAETTLAIGQLVELGGKRAKRLALAGLERELAVWERERERLDVITATRQAFIDVLAAQARLALFEDLVGLAREVQRGVAARVDAGRVSPIEEARAQVAVSRAELDRSRARGELAAARRRLAARWGAEQAEFGNLLGDLRVLPAVPSLGALEAALESNPALARWRTEDERRRRALDLAEAEAVSDLTVSGGLRQFAESGDVGLVFGLAIPIPLFDRNQGTIAAARSELAATGAARQATRLRLLGAIYDGHQALAAAASEVEALHEEVLPLAGRVFEATTTGYEQGKFGYLDVLDAQRTLFEARSRELDALARYQAASADLERLIGLGLEDLAPASGTSTPGATQ